MNQLEYDAQHIDKVKQTKRLIENKTENSAVNENKIMQKNYMCAYKGNIKLNQIYICKSLYKFEMVMHAI